MAKKEYTITEAVRDVLRTMPYNESFYGHEFYATVRMLLRIHGSPARPDDTTISRKFRLFKRQYGIVLVDGRKSLFAKMKESR